MVGDIVDSANNIYRFVDAHFFPDAFNQRTMTGRYVGAHSADLVRLPLLQLYGGVWMDVGTILIRHLDDIWSVIEDPSTPYELAGMTLPLRPAGEETMVNSFLATLRNNGYITRWHRIFLTIWKDSTECAGLHAHPVLRHLPPYTPPAGEPNAPNIPQTREDMSDYLAHMLCHERLRNLVDPSNGFNGRLFYETKTYLLPILREACYFQLKSSWDGEMQFRLLTTPYDVPEVDRDEQYHRAKDVVHGVLTKSTMIKLQHGPSGVTRPWLADLWDDPNNHSADNRPGTFGQYLRQSILRLNQTRPLVPLAVAPLATPIYVSGLLQPIGN